jgi:hypothetical protein
LAGYTSSEEAVTDPLINTLEYVRRALSAEQNSAVVTQNADGTLGISVDIGPGVHQVDLPALEGPAGGPGLPQFPLMLMPDVYTDPRDLPFNLTNTNADIGKYWLITQSDADGVILSAAFIWFGTEYRILPFGVQGPPGPYGVIKPFVTLPGPGFASTIEWEGEGTEAEPYLFTTNLSVPEGPMGRSAPLFNMPDVSHDTPPVSGQLLAFNGETVDVGGDTLSVWEPTSTGDIDPQPYLMPSSAFSSYSGVTFENPVVIATFRLPALPFDWKPLVWGQIEMYGKLWYQILPSDIGILVLLGDADPEVGTLVGRGFGNAARGVVSIMPHCSYPQAPAGPGEPSGVPGSTSIAMTPWNDVAKVSANNTGAESTLYVILVNEGKRWGIETRYDFHVSGSSVFVLACPMTDQDQLSPPLYAGLAVRIKLSGLVED